MEDNVKVKDVSNNEVIFDVTDSTIDYEAEITALKNQLETEHNNYLRALADSDNIRKNFAKKQADLYEFQYEPIMKDLLDILDDTDRAITSGELSEGGTLILSKLGTKLYKFGLSRFVPENGDDFDSDIMEAVTVIPMPDLAGKVVDCTQIGYKYNGKIIRYPKVVVGE